MSKQKKYNTAVIATDKNGNKTKYSSLEAAAKATGLSERTIKSRAVNPGKSGKDKLIFEWVDATTRRAFKAKQSKTKGHGFEYDVVKSLREIGYPETLTATGESKRMDGNKIDVYDPSGELPVYIQCKHTTNQPSYYKIAAECPLKDKPFVLAYRQAHNDGTRPPEPVAIIPLKYFYQLISKK